MNNIEIEAFLAICRNKSISKASEELFISQSSLSSRLKSLEEHLGCPLLLRSKGSREVTLTTWGQAFYDLALQYQEITSRMDSLNKSILVESLSVSTIHSVGTHLLLPAFERFCYKYPQIHLVIQDMWAEMACTSIIHGKTDIAFSTSKIQTSQIIATPFISDPMTFICSGQSDYPDTVDFGMLSTDKEVYALWSAEIDYWHSSSFGVNALPSLYVEFDEQMALFVSKYNKWAVVPKSVAKHMTTHYDIRECKTTFKIPDRHIYMLRGKDRAETDNIHRFLDTLNEVFKNNKYYSPLV